MLDPQRFRRETIRWQILLTLNNARPIGANEAMLLIVARSQFPDVTSMEVRRELDYLEARELLEVEKDQDGNWHSKLTRYGMDVADYTVACDPGIARPEKYWNS